MSEIGIVRSAVDQEGVRLPQAAIDREVDHVAVVKGPLEGLVAVEDHARDQVGEVDRVAADDRKLRHLDIVDETAAGGGAFIEQRSAQRSP